MPLLISISSGSFLILATMIFLRWFGYSFKKESLCYKTFKKSDRWLDKLSSLLQRKIQEHRKDVRFFVYIGKFLLFQIIKLYDILNYLLRRIKLKLVRYFRKISLKEKRETVSEYLRNISDYKKK